MILQALTEYYETLAAKGNLPVPGWEKVKVSFALYLAADGSIEQVADIRTEQQVGKKTQIRPQELVLPAPVKRSSGVLPNFLCDNASYILGFDGKGKPARARACFDACRVLHETLLDSVDSPAARAVLNFFRHWEPEGAEANPLFDECKTDILAGGNFVFLFDSSYVQNDPQIRRVWDQHYGQSDEDAVEMPCLVTGTYGPVARIHPAIMNVAGAQSSGAALVSFNAPAFCSYGKEQNYNAPTGKYAAFAYTSALNYLLKDRTHVYRLGDTTVLCWAKGGGSDYQNLFAFAYLGNTLPHYTDEDLGKMVKALCNGSPVLMDESRLDPNMEFYVLGLAPNAARLSIRFFFKNSFGSFLKNAQAHQERLSICRPSFDNNETLPLWMLLRETVNQNARDKAASPGLTGEVLRAVLTDTPYPASLLHGVTLRIRAEHEINRVRAAIIKAYYLKNTHSDVPEEVLIMPLNPDSTNVPYILGRLFSVLEAIQSAANPGINTTIKDRYFNSASSSPAQVFPNLINLAQKHLRKLETGQRIYFEKQLGDLTNKLNDAFPARLNLPMQGAFQLGYYQQTQKRYEKREVKENV